MRQKTSRLKRQSLLYVHARIALCLPSASNSNTLTHILIPSSNNTSLLFLRAPLWSHRCCRPCLFHRGRSIPGGCSPLLVFGGRWCWVYLWVNPILSSAPWGLLRIWWRAVSPDTSPEYKGSCLWQAHYSIFRLVHGRRLPVYL